MKEAMNRAMGFIMAICGGLFRFAKLGSDRKAMRHGRKLSRRQRLEKAPEHPSGHGKTTIAIRGARRKARAAATRTARP